MNRPELLIASETTTPSSPYPHLSFTYCKTLFSIKCLYFECQYWWCVGHKGIRFSGLLSLWFSFKWCTATILDSSQIIHFLSWCLHATVLYCATSSLWYFSAFALPPTEFAQLLEQKYWDLEGNNFSLYSTSKLASQEWHLTVNLIKLPNLLLLASLSFS